MKTQWEKEVNQTLAPAENAQIVVAQAPVAVVIGTFAAVASAE